MGNEPGTPKLIVEPSVGVAGEPAPIRLALRGRANDAVVIISGLIPGMELSTGSAITSDSWQLSASDLPYASIAPPQDFVGSADLVAELRLPNAQIADRQMLHLEWTRPAAVPELQHEQEQITRQKEVEPVPPIAPPTVAHSNDRDVTTAAPPNSAELLTGPTWQERGQKCSSTRKEQFAPLLCQRRQSSCVREPPGRRQHTSRQRILGLVAISEPCRRWNEISAGVRTPCCDLGLSFRFALAGGASGPSSGRCY